MAGRPKDPVWLGFEKTDTVSGPRAKCRGCGLSLSGLVDRLKKHVNHCARLDGFGRNPIENTSEAATDSAAAAAEPNLNN